MKAILFRHYITAKKILNATTALEYKMLSKEIDNYDWSTWEQCTKDRCKLGICQKFAQNSALKDILIHCTRAKTIVKSTSDSFWGSGVPLHRNDCLNPRQWISRGIMSEILMELRDELRCAQNHPSVDIQTEPKENIGSVRNTPQSESVMDTQQVI